VLIVLTLYPFYHVLMASFSQSDKFIAYKGILLHPSAHPRFFRTSGFEEPNILNGFRNTLFVVVVGVAVNLFMTSLGAYFLSRKNVMWRDLIMMLIVFTMYFNGGLIPLYFTVRSLGLYNSLFSLIFPVAINTTNLIIMRTAFAAVPDSLEESAKIDGASHFAILFRIIIPASMATVAVMILYYGVAHWNAWFNAMIFLRKRERFPLQLILREILILNSTESMTLNSDSGEIAFAQETIKHALTIVSTVPILILYPFFQRFFVKGVMIGALKG
jgi:putative aldouronate transport system permease protein